MQQPQPHHTKERAMNGKFASIAGLATALALLITAPANAVTSIVQFSGTVLVGNDTGNFLPSNGNLNVITGMDFLAEYVIQDPTPGAESYYNGPDYLQYIGSHSTSPVLSAKFTIAGVTKDLGAPDFGVVHVVAASGNEFGVNFVTGGFASDVYYDAFIFATVPAGTFADPVIPTSLDVDVTANRVTSLIFIDDAGYSSMRLTVNHLKIFSADGSTDPGTALPEPTAWTLMLVGFGLVGGGMRKARRSGRRGFA
jgi:hypothetical protein